MENYEKLEAAISDALDKLDPTSPTYKDDVEAVAKLYGIKGQEDRNQNDYYVRAEELANETERLEKESKWYNKVNWVQIGSTVAASMTVFGMMLANMAFQKDGYIGINPAELMKIGLNRVK